MLFFYDCQKNLICCGGFTKQRLDLHGQSKEERPLLYNTAQAECSSTTVKKLLCCGNLLYKKLYRSIEGYIYYMHVSRDCFEFLFVACAVAVVSPFGFPLPFWIFNSCVARPQNLFPSWRGSPAWRAGRAGPAVMRSTMGLAMPTWALSLCQMVGLWPPRTAMTSSMPPEQSGGGSSGGQRCLSLSGHADWLNYARQMAEERIERNGTEGGRAMDQTQLQAHFTELQSRTEYLQTGMDNLLAEFQKVAGLASTATTMAKDA